MPIETATDARSGQGWTEVKAPEMYQFSRVNDSVTGVLMDIDQVTIKGKPTMQYLLQLKGGKRVTFLATWDLQKKIQPDHVNQELEVTYEGEDHTVETQGSPLRKFRVRVRPRQEQAA